MTNFQYLTLTKNISAQQQVLLDWQGYVLESTDTIFSTHLLKHRPCIEWSFFLESLFPTIHSLELHSPEIIFPRVSSITNFLEGIYDCTLMRVEWGDNDKVIVWNIIDYTQDLPAMQQRQQLANELAIKKQISMR